MTVEQKLEANCGACELFIYGSSDPQTRTLIGTRNCSANGMGCGSDTCVRPREFTIKKGYEWVQNKTFRIKLP